jgi:hypothetical protein
MFIEMHMKIEEKIVMIYIFMHKKATLIPYWVGPQNTKQYKGPFMVRMSILEC